MDPEFMGYFNQALALMYSTKLKFGWPQFGVQPDVQHAELAAHLANPPHARATIELGGRLFDFLPSLHGQSVPPLL